MSSRYATQYASLPTTSLFILLPSGSSEIKQKKALHFQLQGFFGMYIIELTPRCLFYLAGYLSCQIHYRLDIIIFWAANEFSVP